MFRRSAERSGIQANAKPGLAFGTIGQHLWHVSAIHKFLLPKYLLVEQFWGRAARASRDSKPSRDARFIFGILSIRHFSRWKYECYFYERLLAEC